MGSRKVLSFSKLSYVIGGVYIVVRRRANGNWEDEIFSGTIEELHTDHNKALHDRLDGMEVIALDVEQNTLLIGVDDC